ncbi:hypothetical protein HMPREF1544_04094 [Mucor circinelloides 1006PhL]|uniref:Uncharacterized protein n=1 Tax=Mucor circinelloides f. circinelloides (strain 1006PhL) TaxID=1220926 RepID=S2JKS7_MUCC1|nr:hypothetical protein HMPREF1544_04094 [Mucor circinelloides 1006PhL]
MRIVTTRGGDKSNHRVTIKLKRSIKLKGPTIDKLYRKAEVIFEDNLEVLRGETASYSSRKRKNKERSIGGIEARDVKKIGYKSDMIFHKTACSHDEVLEFGAIEAGKNFEEGDGATKKLIEGSIKLP